jgi:hypothetical protein
MGKTSSPKYASVSCLEQYARLWQSSNEISNGIVREIPRQSGTIPHRDFVGHLGQRKNPYNQRVQLDQVHHDLAPSMSIPISEKHISVRLISARVIHTKLASSCFMLAITATATRGFVNVTAKMKRKSYLLSRTTDIDAYIPVKE